MDQNVEFSFVIPCLNEAETLGACIDKARQSIEALCLAAEVVVADNGSTDGSRDIAREHGAIVAEVEEKGYGAALAGGVALARGTYVIMGDGDGSYDFSDVLPFVDRLRQGYDLVMGCRFPWGGGRIMPGAMPLKHKYLGNPVLTGIGKLFFKSPVMDFHCGLRGFRKDAALRMDLHTSGMEFASEMVIKATLMQMKITQVPITLYKDGRSRSPHLRSWQDGWRHLRFMLLYSPGWLFLLPGFVLTLAGGLAFMTLVRSPVTIGSVNFDTNTLLVSAMSILLGVQLLTFYLFSRTFSIQEGFLPITPLFAKCAGFFRLERGLLVSLAVLVAGLALLISSLTQWGRVGFGNLSYPDSLRQVIPSVLLILLGVHGIFSSFFISILSIRRRGRD